MITPEMATEALNKALPKLTGRQATRGRLIALGHEMRRHIDVRHVMVRSYDRGVFVVDVYPHQADAFRLTLGMQQ